MKTPKPKKLTDKQYRTGYSVALAALKTLARGMPENLYQTYAGNVVKNLESGKFLS